MQRQCVIELLVCLSTVSCTATHEPVPLAPQAACQPVEGSTTEFGVAASWRAETSEGEVVTEWCLLDPENPDGEVAIRVALRERSHPWSACPSLIRGEAVSFGPYPYNMLSEGPPAPYGQRLANRDFARVSDERPTDTAGLAEGLVLDTGIGDAGLLVMCLRGDWVFFGYH